MFSKLQKCWAEARADVAADDVEVLLNRFRRLDPNSCYFVVSAFVEVQSSVEAQYGDTSYDGNWVTTVIEGGVSRRVSSLPEPVTESDTP